jgi:hypothetical protein
MIKACLSSYLRAFPRSPVLAWAPNLLRPFAVATGAVGPASRHVDVIVGGMSYPLLTTDLSNYSNGELGRAIENTANGTPIEYNRDGALFRYIYSFLVSGHLPNNRDLVLLAILRDEANFYGVTALANECDRFLGTGEKVDPMALLQHHSTTSSCLRGQD